MTACGQSDNHIYVAASNDDAISDSASRKAGVSHSNATMLQPVILITCMSTVTCWQNCTERNTIGHSILVYDFEQFRVIVGHCESVTFCLSVPA